MSITRDSTASGRAQPCQLHPPSPHGAFIRAMISFTKLLFFATTSAFSCLSFAEMLSSDMLGKGTCLTLDRNSRIIFSPCWKTHVSQSHYHVFMCVWHMPVDTHMPGDRVSPPGARFTFTDGQEPPNVGSWEPNLEPLGEQQGLFPAGSSLWHKQWTFSNFHLNMLLDV